MEITVDDYPRLLNQIVTQTVDMGRDVNQIFDPVSQSQVSIPTIMKIVKDFIHQYEDKMSTKDKVVRDDIIKNTPEYKNGEIVPKAFQEMAQRFIRNLPLEYKLERLNKMQKSCPFLLADPLLRPVTGPINYGLADLYRFMGLPLNNISIAKFSAKKPVYKPKLPPVYIDIDGNPQKNPLFHPVKYNYPIPDLIGNEALKKIYMNNPSFMFSKLVGLYDQLGRYQKMTGGGIIAPASKEHNKYYIHGGVNEMIKLIYHLMKKELDPYYLTHTLLSKDVDGEGPPMKTYFHTELDALLFQLLTSHRIYNIHNKKVTTDMEISSKALDKLKSSLAEYEKHPMMVSASYHTSKPIPKHRSKRSSKRRSKRRSSRK